MSTPENLLKAGDRIIAIGKMNPLPSAERIITLSGAERTAQAFFEKVRPQIGEFFGTMTIGPKDSAKVYRTVVLTSPDQAGGPNDLRPLAIDSPLLQGQASGGGDNKARGRRIFTEVVKDLDTVCKATLDASFLLNLRVLAANYVAQASGSEMNQFDHGQLAEGFLHSLKIGAAVEDFLTCCLGQEPASEARLKERLESFEEHAKLIAEKLGELKRYLAGARTSDDAIASLTEEGEGKGRAEVIKLMGERKDNTFAFVTRFREFKKAADRLAERVCNPVENGYMFWFLLSCYGKMESRGAMLVTEGIAKAFKAGFEAWGSERKNAEPGDYQKQTLERARAVHRTAIAKLKEAGKEDLRGFLALILELRKTALRQRFNPSSPVYWDDFADEYAAEYADLGMLCVVKGLAEHEEKLDAESKRLAPFHNQLLGLKDTDGHEKVKTILSEDKAAAEFLGSDICKELQKKKAKGRLEWALAFEEWVDVIQAGSLCQFAIGRGEEFSTIQEGIKRYVRAELSDAEVGLGRAPESAQPLLSTARPSAEETEKILSQLGTGSHGGAASVSQEQTIEIGAELQEAMGNANQGTIVNPKGDVVVRWKRHYGEKEGGGEKDPGKARQYMVWEQTETSAQALKNGAKGLQVKPDADETKNPDAAVPAKKGKGAPNRDLPTEIRNKLLEKLDLAKSKPPQPSSPGPGAAPAELDAAQLSDSIEGVVKGLGKLYKAGPSSDAQKLILRRIRGLVHSRFILAVPKEQTYFGKQHLSNMYPLMAEITRQLGDLDLDADGLLVVPAKEDLEARLAKINLSHFFPVNSPEDLARISQWLVKLFKSHERVEQYLNEINAIQDFLSSATHKKSELVAVNATLAELAADNDDVSPFVGKGETASRTAWLTSTAGATRKSVGDLWERFGVWSSLEGYQNWNLPLFVLSGGAIKADTDAEQAARENLLAYVQTLGLVFVCPEDRPRLSWWKVGARPATGADLALLWLSAPIGAVRGYGGFAKADQKVVSGKMGATQGDVLVALRKKLFVGVGDKPEPDVADYLRGLLWTRMLTMAVVSRNDHAEEAKIKHFFNADWSAAGLAGVFDGENALRMTVNKSHSFLHVEGAVSSLGVTSAKKESLVTGKPAFADEFRLGDPPGAVE